MVMIILPTAYIRGLLQKLKEMICVKHFSQGWEHGQYLTSWIVAVVVILTLSTKCNEIKKVKPLILPGETKKVLEKQLTM